MSYEVSICANTKIISVTYTGNINLAERKAAVVEVCDRFAEQRPLKILINVINLIMVLTLDEQKELGKLLANHPILSDARVAVLHEKEANPNMMIDIIAFTNGYLLAEFISESEAKKWLLGV